MWTKGQLTTYREQGFLVQRGLIPPDRIERLRSVFCIHRNVQPFRELCRLEWRRFLGD